MRYVKIPKEVHLQNPETGEPMEQTVPFATSMRTATAQMTDKLDALALIDLRAKLCGDVGTTAELTEDEWAALAATLRRPSFYNPIYLFAAETHLRAVLDASTEKPS